MRRCISLGGVLAASLLLMGTVRAGDEPQEKQEKALDDEYLKNAVPFKVEPFNADFRRGEIDIHFRPRGGAGAGGHR